MWVLFSLAMICSNLSVCEVDAEGFHRDLILVNLAAKSEYCVDDVILRYHLPQERCVALA